MPYYPNWLLPTTKELIVSYLVTYIDNKRIFEGSLTMTAKNAKTEFQAINEILQMENISVYKIVKVEKLKDE